jgi:hypothetical protein
VGCIVALDGIELAIKKPHDHYFLRKFYIRKLFYALPIQPVRYSNFILLYMSARCVGSTHDSFVWAVSILGQRFQDGLCLGIYWLAGESVYVCLDSILTIKLNYRTESSEIVASPSIFSFELAYAHRTCT